jgi:hypothetical protein
VLARNQILQHGLISTEAGFVNASQRLNLLTTELQAGVMKTRMQPIGNVWNRFPRIVRDLANVCGKKVTLELDGTEIAGWSGLSDLELRFDIELDDQSRWWLKLFARPSASEGFGSAIVAQRVATINALPAFSTYVGQVDSNFALQAGTAGLRLDTIKVSVDWLRLDVP